MEWKHEELPYLISDDKQILNKEQVCEWLQTTYWASERSSEMIQKGIDNSLCFGLYDKRELAGFVRVVSDYATFSWVCDVYIAPAHRGLGLGKWLMEVMTTHPAICHTNMTLATRDAHGLYEQYGFVRREMMRRMAGGN